VSGQIPSSWFLAILPEIGLLVLAGLVLVLDVTARGKRGGSLAWVTAGGLAVVAVLSVAFARPGAEALLLWGGMLRLDAAGFVFRLIFLLGAAVTALFALESPTLRERGEFFALLLVSTLGMSLMASSADLVMLYLAIETTSIPLYVLAGFILHDQKSVESGVKYLLFGAMASGIMLFGFSLLYGFTGSTQLYEIAGKLMGFQPVLLSVAALLMVLVGFAFKISAVPLHFWAPDVYEGAPSPVAGFLSTASKAAGFAVLMRVALASFPADLANVWPLIVAVMATASMILGNFLAVAQKNIKRLLAYSSIAQAGYILIGVAAANSLGISGALYYLMAYLVTNLAAFGIVTLVGRAIGSDEISSYAGLSRRSPALGMALLAALLSLGGIPPFAGFFGKLLVFASAIQANLVWLAVVGILNAIVGLYYYLNVLKVVYLYRSADDAQPLSLSPGWTAALVVCVVGILVLGFIFSPWYTWANQAAGSLLLAPLH